MGRRHNFLAGRVGVLGKEATSHHIERVAAHLPIDKRLHIVPRTTSGIEAIAKLWGSEKISLTEDAVIWNARQRASLSTAYELLSDAAAALKLGAPPDAACTMAESALSALSELDGRGVCEDIVAEVFARFCVGK